MVWVHLLHSNIMDGHIHISVVNNIHCGKKKIVAALALWVLFIVVPVDSATDPSDVKALGVLYNSLNSPSQLSNWKSNDNGDPCGESWKGISCSGSSVVSIQIQGLGLIGSLGYLLSNLLSLKTLDVSNNKIHDTIPYQVPPNLTHLNLASNNFSGNLPYSISAMTSLEYLNVGHNSLSQVIGDIFTNLHHLLTLDLSSNNFSGNLPKSLGDLSKLSTLHLQNNKLSGPVNVLANIHLSDLYDT
ncbi:hypothetical protein ZOSMA_487G00100 [Zostera marina]|uniref:Leucine-rich repeat-containing N-terminal plant-type domain-containing protein n=1 Tax=Zostera marina TaxID=29655 RepID=A0A0K9P1T3_ZOSMR|nr:hypothetical protein ZOSMA_487G00100 [Zostera marina]